MARPIPAAVDPAAIEYLDALLRTDARAAIRPLLALWQTTFDPGLGVVLELVGAFVAEPVAALPPKRTARADRLAELARTTGPEDRSAVLAALEAFVKEASPATARPSVEAWLEVAPDPRVARAAMRIFAASQGTASAKLLRRLVGCLERHGDPSVPAEHASIVARITSGPAGWGLSPERLANVVKKLEKERRCRTAVAPETLARWRSRFTSAPEPERAVTEESLLAGVVASPDDDAPRLVYADWLNERRDPRGELIALQIARSRGEAARGSKKREAELVAEVGQAQLGPLGPAVVRTEIVYRRGFAAKVRAKGQIPACAATRLLEEVQFAGFHALEDFKRGARFDAVRRAVGPFHAKSRRAFPALAPRLVDWEVGARFLWGGWVPEVPWPGQPSDALERLDESLYAARGLRLERFATSSPPDDAPATFARLVAHEALRDTATRVLRVDGSVWTVRLAPGGLEVLLERGPSQTGYSPREAAARTLGALPRGSVTRLGVRSFERGDEAAALLAALRGTEVAAECELESGP